ncbi:MAG TPA: hypothetical protein VHV75_04965 [Solirubrobacteraceae bacterium]|jgi:hypothetical protein|nr:hypothetical protein [Solirubrobacteraceae bacterium]
MGLINLEPTLHNGEEVVWRRPAARSLERQTVPGMLYLTSDALLFMPNRLNRRRDIVSTRIPHEQLIAVDTIDPVLSRASRQNGGLRRRLRVQAPDETHLFVIKHPDQVAQELRASVRESPEPT